MIQFHTPCKIDCKKYEDEIGLYGFDIYVNPLSLNMTRIEAKALEDSAYFALRRECFLASNGEYKECSGDTVIDILIRYCYIPPDKIPRTSSGKYSLSKVDTFQPLLTEAKHVEKDSPYLSEKIINLIEAYINYSEAKTYRESMEAKLPLMEKTTEVDYRDKTLCTIHGIYEKQSTGRYYTKNDNFIAWNKKATWNFTVPKDYFLVWADFGQIDLRVAMNLILYKDAPEMARDDIEDKYEAFARAVYSKAHKDFNYEKFKDNRPAYKKSILSRMYGASKLNLLGNGFTDIEEVNELDNFFLNHKYYNIIKNSLENVLKYNTDMTIYDYFGETRDIDLKNNSKKMYNHNLKAAFNTPIQSTSNSILILWTLWIVDAFRSLGFNRDKFRPYLMRHDEGVFLCHKDIIPYLYLFKQSSSVSIDDWTELITEVSMGYNYKVPDVDLLQLYDKSIEDNKDKIIPFKKGLAREEKFYPVKNVFYCYSFAPFGAEKIFYKLFENDSSFALEIDEVKYNMTRDTAKARNLASKAIDYYCNLDPRTNIVNPELIDYLKYYKKLNKLFFYTDATGETHTMNISDLADYINKNNIGYVVVYNSFKDDYVLHKDVRWKYEKLDKDSILTVIAKAGWTYDGN